MSTSPETVNAAIDYPASLTIDYPAKNRNRLTSIFRIFVAIPILIIICLMTNGAFSTGSHAEGWRSGIMATGLLFLPLVLMILFRTKYPRWWFDWNFALAKFCYRVSSYIALLRDEIMVSKCPVATNNGPRTLLGVLTNFNKAALAYLYSIIRWSTIRM